MALGFGFNKAKVLTSAEKYVQQGKLQNAISEYEKVVKQDPKDLTVLNTIGDLYARLGQSDQASAYFRRVGDAYAADGFTVKAIAMYKKLTKLAPSSMDGLQKLADLYTQQGLYNDARQQYVALADHWMRANDLEAAARTFQKLLELDPENAAMQTRLADLYIRMGKKDDAKDIYFRASETLYQRAAMDAADEALGHVLSIDPGNSRALLKRGLIAVDSGDSAAAIRHLHHLKQIESNPDALGILLRAHLLAGDLGEGEKVARNLVAQHKDLSGIQAIAEWLMSRGSYRESLALYREFSGQLSLSNTESLRQALEAALHKVKEDAPSLEIIRELFRHLDDTGHITECTELLAHALVQAGDLERARDLFRELADTEPENPVHEQQYRQVLTKLGEDAAVRPLTTAEGAQAFMVDELEISAPPVPQEYSGEIAEAIESALTDSELLDSYSGAEKALAPLEKALPQAPRDVRLNQRLASLYAGVNRFADAARCCDVLASVYRHAGYADQARQYGDMSTRYGERARTTPPPAHAAAAQPPAAEYTVEAPPPEVQTTEAQAPEAQATEVQTTEAQPAGSSAAPAAPAAPAAASVHEIDISDEWETHATSGPPAAAAEPPSVPGDLLDEIRFYISQAMWKEARAACAHGETLAPGNPDLAALQAQLPAAAEIEQEQAVDIGITVPPPAPSAGEAAGPAKADVLKTFVSDLEQSLGTDFAVAGKPAPAPSATPPPAARPAGGAAAAPARALEAASSTAPQPAQQEASTVLTDMFEEFKEDAEAGAEEVEDPDTHYNLGVAFREMGLLDEAIGELQKVCHAIDRGASFSQTMQAYTWLAQCFVEKGVPEASFKWYERALKISTDEQQRMSLHYDFAHACEEAGNRKSALQHYMEVYGSNIDYRDVAERIKSLRS